MGLISEITRELQIRSWPFARGRDEKAPEQPSPYETRKTARERKLSSFCDPSSEKPCITVCRPRGECVCDCFPVRDALLAAIDRLKLDIKVGDAKVGCAGKCRSGPIIGFPQKGYFYLRVQPRDVPDIVYETIIKGRILFPFLSIDSERSYRSDIYYEKDTGFLAAIDSSVCMVEVTKYFLDFEKGISCGKCVPCRLGMQRMYESIDRIVAGEGSLQDLEQLRTLSQSMISLPRCEFAMTSTRPVLSALTYFEDEFLAHIDRKECPAQVCKELLELQRKEERRRKRRR